MARESSPGGPGMTSERAVDGWEELRRAVLAALRDVPSDYPDVVPRSDAVMAIDDLFSRLAAARGEPGPGLDFDRLLAATEPVSVCMSCRHAAHAAGECAGSKRCLCPHGLLATPEPDPER